MKAARAPAIAPAAVSGHHRPTLKNIPNPVQRARRGPGPGSSSDGGETAAAAAAPRSADGGPRPFPRRRRRSGGGPSVRQAWALARELAASAPWRCALALLLLLTAGVTEAFGLLMVIPLLQVAGVADAAGEPGRAAEAAARIAAEAGVPLTLPGVLGVFLGLAAVRSAVAWRRNILVTRLRLEFTDRVREEIYAAVAGASWGHLLGRRRSDIQHVLTNDVARIGTAAFMIVQLVVSGTLASMQFAVALAVSPAIAAGAMLLGVPLALAARPMFRRSHALGAQLTGATRGLRGFTTDFLDGLKPAKSHNAEGRHLRRIVRAARAARERQIAFAGLRAATQAGLQLVTAAALAGLIWYAIAGAGVSLPEITVLVLVFARATPTALGLLQIAQQIANALPAYASATGLRDALRAAAEPEGGPEGGAKRAPGLRGDIEVRDLAFAYPGAGAPVLRGIGCSIPANGIFAITGPSGAGKSTLADLLLGLLEPTRGEILVGGAPLREAGLARWRRSTAYVPQEPFLLHDSVRANLCWTCAEATEADMWRALERAGASEFVSSLPNRLDTVVGDRGGRLSGGERQRIALAAALLREPALLVLDEPASHLDSGNEARMIETLRRLRGRAAIVAVVHGGALLREADRILVLRSGRVDALGPWPEVAASASEDAVSPARTVHEHRRTAD